MGVDDTHAYIASGMIPSWYLLAVNLETGEAKVLLESPTERRMDVINTFPGARVIVPQSGGVSDKEYWLYHGQAIPKVNDTPPWPRLESPWDKAGPKPEIYRGQVDPDAGGKAALWYRLPEDKSRTDAKEKASRGSSTSAKPEDLGWRKVSLKVEMYSHRISALALLPDGRLFSAGEDYVGSFIFDPKSGLSTLLGRNQGIAAYTHIVLGNKLYSSGYPGGPLYVFDPKLPWTVYKGGPPVIRRLIGRPGPAIPVSWVLWPETRVLRSRTVPHSVRTAKFTLADSASATTPAAALGGMPRRPGNWAGSGSR